MPRSGPCIGAKTPYVMPKTVDECVTSPWSMSFSPPRPVSFLYTRPAYSLVVLQFPLLQSPFQIYPAPDRCPITWPQPVSVYCCSSSPRHSDSSAGPALGLVALALLAGGVVLQFFVILSGTRAGLPTNLVYFLQTTTNGISGARNPARWTYFAICGADGTHNTDCGAVVPALPFDPARNFGTDTGIPSQFLGTHKFYYLSRFAWVFYLVALFFAVVACTTGLLSLCSKIGAYLSSVTTMVALFFQTLAAALIT